jgi:hypothetical protein
MKNEEQNANFKLIIRRSDAFTGATLKTNVLINNKNHGKVGHNSKIEINLPRIYTKIKLYNKIPLGRNIVKEFVVDPLMNNTVEVCVSYEMNMLAFIPPFTFLIPTSIIKTEICYFE